MVAPQRPLYVLRTPSSSTYYYTVNHYREVATPSVIAFSNARQAHQFKHMVTSFQDDADDIDMVKVDMRRLAQHCALSELNIVVYTHKHRVIHVQP